MIAFRKMGKENSRLETFCGIMNMPPMNLKAFNNMQSKVADIYVNISKVSMTEATEGLHLNSIQEGEPENSITNVAVSCDGKRQRRCHSSLNGVVNVISADTGKCLDYQVMSKHCDACNYWEDKKNTESDKYDNFMATPH